MSKDYQIHVCSGIFLASFPVAFLVLRFIEVVLTTTIFCMIRIVKRRKENKIVLTLFVAMECERIVNG